MSKRPCAERRQAVSDILASTRTRKGDFAQALAEVLRSGDEEARSFPTPIAFRTALRRLVE